MEYLNEVYFNITGFKYGHKWEHKTSLPIEPSLLEALLEDLEEFKANIAEVGGDLHTLYVSELVEIDDLLEYNRLLLEYEDINECEQSIIKYLVNEEGLELDDAFYRKDDVTFYPNADLEDVAQELVDEGVFGDVSDSLKSYIDFETLGNELRHDNFVEFNGDVFRMNF